MLGKVEVDEKTPGMLEQVGAAPVSSGELLLVWGKGGARERLLLFSTWASRGHAPRTLVPLDVEGS